MESFSYYGTRVLQIILIIACFAIAQVPEGRLYPPVAITTGTVTLTREHYGAGSYSVTQSSTVALQPFLVFDRDSATYFSTDDLYATDGAYGGSIVTTDSLSNSYYGEYIEFTLPSMVYAVALEILPRQDGDSYLSVSPTGFVLLGYSEALSVPGFVTILSSSSITWDSKESQRWYPSATISARYSKFRLVIPSIIGGADNSPCQF
eukprot:gene19907-23638_t